MTQKQTLCNAKRQMKNEKTSRTLIQLTLKAWVLIVLIMGISLSAQGQIFSTPKNISDDIGITQHAQIEMDEEGNTYTVWADGTEGISAIYFSRSIDGGQTFSDPKNISYQNSYSAYFPKIAIGDQGYIYLVWVQSYPQDHIWISYSSDYGATFSPPKVIAAADGGAEIAVDSQGNVNIVLYDIVYPARYVYFCRSIDNGETFSSPIYLSIGTAPKIAVDSDGKIYIVWDYDEIYFTCSSNGETFSDPVNLSADLYDGNSNPEMVVDSGGNINIVWRNAAYAGNEVYFRRSTDGGATFDTPVNVSNTPNKQSASPQIAVDSQGHISVAWWQGVEGSTKTDIFFSYSTDGTCFSAPTNISNTLTVSSQRQKIAVDDQGNINIIWDEHDPDSGIFFSRSVDGGMSFSEPKDLYVGAATPQCTIDNTGDVFAVCWKDDDIHFIRSLDSLFFDLIDLTNEINLNSLDAKLDVAIRILEDSNDNNDRAGIQALEAFIRQVEAQRDVQISDEYADTLIGVAQIIVNLLE
ncbi:sialidase family protein [Planctomycetota bacterium]